MKVTRCFRVLAFALLAISLMTPKAKSEIIDLDFSGLTDPFTRSPQFIQALRDAESVWDARLLGYSNTINRDIQTQLNGRLTITINDQAAFPAGVIATAGPTNVVQSFLGGRNRAVATAGVLNFDPDTLVDFTFDEITEVVTHEISHVLGFGTLWDANDLLENIPARGGIPEFRGINARRTFAQEAGFNRPQVAYVPIELEGGAGTALAHWDDDNFFFNSQNRDNRVELLTGFFVPNTERFLSETTFASMVDLGYVVSGFNEDELINFSNPINPIFPKRSGRRIFNNTTNLTLAGATASATAVPEPSALVLVLAGMSGMLLRRRRAV